MAERQVRCPAWCAHGQDVCRGDHGDNKTLAHDPVTVTRLRRMRERRMRARSVLRAR